MQGSKKVLEALNQLLADELTAINQYMVHAELASNWGYAKLHKAIEKQAFDEMHHAEWLIERIIFLDGSPTVSKLNKITIGKTVPDMIGNDQSAELDAVRSYNQGIALAREEGDEASADLLRKILKMEEDHVNWAEEQRAQIAQMGLENYLARQTEGAAS